ncbi:MAG TPA: hypothetical protein VGV37_03830, partial [Aliidongia sp.]|uniref:hypothetical protein n=1 Tax=Aliidongia sp. TaxID=1914230 RepID=UPI002DDD11DA
MARLLRTFRDGIGTVLGPSRLFPLVLLLSIVPSLGFGTEIPLDEPGFTKALAKLFRKALPGTKVTIDGPLSLEVRPPDGDTHQSSLHTLYDFCQRNPQKCAAAVQNHVAQMSDTYHLGEVAPDRKLLRAVLRPSSYVEEIRKMYAGKGEPPVAPFMGDLWIICALDLPQAIRTLGPGDLAKLGLSRAEALALATKNDADILVPIEQAAHPFPGGEVSLVATSPYEASRLLAPES